jgi:thymidylate kinase
MAERGRLIAIDGGRWVGKTTIATYLALALPGTELISDHAPGMSFISPENRDRWNDPNIGSDSARSAAKKTLFEAGERAGLGEVVLKPNLELGTNIVSDGWWTSSLAHRGAEGISPSHIIRSNRLALGDALLMPDLLVILDAGPTTNILRLPRRERPAQLHYLPHHNQVRNLFLTAAHEMGGVVVNASRSVEAVCSETRQIVQERLGI